MIRKHTPARSPRRLLSLSALALLITGSLLYAGPLNPPAGPVSSTGKTTQEIFDKVASAEPRTAINLTNTPGDADSLFKITTRGSYYLTGNINGVLGKAGIEIVTSGVTLDLNGFDLLGVAAIGGFDGVTVTAGSLRNIAVVNGSVRNWGGEGVDLGSANAVNCRVEGVLASGNIGTGIFAGVNNTVTNCSAYQNTGTGIFTLLGSTVTNCTAYLNTGNGIGADFGGTVSNCSAYDNTGDGISAGPGSTVSNCSASSNTVFGINTNFGCTVADCTTRLNARDGIVCINECIIRGNTCSFNGSGGDGAGIHVFGSDNRIEGNNCVRADRGIDVDAAGNIIIRNTCAGNTTNWDIVAGNAYGPIVATPAGAAVNGNTAAAALGSTDPHANFTY